MLNTNSSDSKSSSSSSSSVLIPAVAFTSLVGYTLFQKNYIRYSYTGSDTHNTTMTTATTTGKCPFQFDRALKKDTYPEAAAQDSKTGVISNLSNPRSSDGMGLPTAMCPATLETVTATAPVVGPKALTITKTFYKNVIGAAPGLLQWFNPAVRTILSYLIHICMLFYSI